MRSQLEQREYETGRSMAELRIVNPVRIVGEIRFVGAAIPVSVGSLRIEMSDQQGLDARGIMGPAEHDLGDDSNAAVCGSGKGLCTPDPGLVL